MIRTIKKNFITVSLSILMVLVLLSAGLSLYNRSVMIQYTVLQKQINEVTWCWKSIYNDVVQKTDLALRGYALTKNTLYLEPYEEALNQKGSYLRKIDSLLIIQKLDTLQAQFSSFKLILNNYIHSGKLMKETIDRDTTTAGFVQMMDQHKVLEVWQAYQPLYTNVIQHQNDLLAATRYRFERAQSANIIVQCLLALFTLPTLIGMVVRLRKDTRERKELLLEFERNNRRYMFDPGTDLPDDNPQIIIESSIQNLKRASAFVKDISSGNYAATWEGLSPDNASRNHDNLAGDLIKMRDQMKRVKQEDEKRLWTTEGLAKFSDVARLNQDNIEKLSNEVVRFLSNYLKAQQASLFVLHDEEGEESYLELMACYAFDKKKYVQKRVDLGSGLVGQAYKEGTTTLLTKLPTGYVTITSGLGNATPTCLIIVPMKYNEQVEAILELASFNLFEQHEIQFLEKVGEVIASALYSTKINQRTTKLLKESQEQAETLKSQEEELRQNMEELQATQENMRRKQSEG